MRFVMVSCVQREAEREKTLGQLARVGIRPEVFLSPCAPACGAQQRATAWEALQKVEPTFFFEDDIDIDVSCWNYWMNRLRLDLDYWKDGPMKGQWNSWTMRAITFIVLRDSLYPQRLHKYRPDFVRLKGVSERRGFYGTHAIYLPRNAISLMHRHKSSFVEEDGSKLKRCDCEMEDRKKGCSVDALDFWIKNNSIVFNGIWATYPNPVQHRNPFKMKNYTHGLPPQPKGGHQSSSYGLFENMRLKLAGPTTVVEGVTNIPIREVVE